MIAECPARPALAERLVTSWYASDQRIHRDLKQRAEAELQAHPSIDQMKQLNGTYSEVEFVKSGSRYQETTRSGGHSVKLNCHEWDETMEKLAAIFNGRAVAAGVPAAKGEGLARIRIGIISPLQQDESRCYAMAVIEKTNDYMRLATVAWLKESLESWLARAQRLAPSVLPEPGSNYRLPELSAGGCIEDTWAAIAGAPEIREGHTAVWTGNEMVVWGGLAVSSGIFNTGGRYNPATDT